MRQFRISDEEFTVGLFQDIDQAIGTRTRKWTKAASTCPPEYDTSRQLNAFLSEHRNAVFFVEGHGGCWRLKVRHDQ